MADSQSSSTQRSSSPIYRGRRSTYQIPRRRQQVQDDGVGSRIVRGFIYTCFILALLLSFIMTSVFVYKRLYYYPSRIIGSPTASTSVTSNIGRLPGSWHLLPSLPSPQADNAAVYAQVQGRGYVYMSGGYHGHTYFPNYDHNLYRYDVAAARWQIVSGNFPSMVNNAVALDEQNNLYFVPGYSSDNNAIASLLYKYPLSDSTQCSVTPCGYHALQKIITPVQVSIGFGAAILADQQGHLYITQGFIRPGVPQARAGTGWYRYDTASRQWHVLAPMPLGLGYTALASDNVGGIVMLGGAVDAGQHLISMNVYRYDIMNNVWTQEPAPAPVAFSGAATCTDGQGHLVIAGGSTGYDANGERMLGQSWLVDLYTLRWQALAPLPSGGSLLGTAACDGQGHVFVVRGANASETPTTDFLMLTIK
jgi:N-acetylneuraminic acid mutarotase